MTRAGQMTDAHELPHSRRVFWDRFFWQAAETPSGMDAAEAILTATDLHVIAGDDLYAELVSWAADPMAKIDARAIYDTLFPRHCFCRKHSTMDYNELAFSGRNVYRRLYYVDECIEQHTECLFRRTPDIDLLRCRECGDVWLRGMDQDWLRRHYLLLEPGDIESIQTNGHWPAGLDHLEDTWIAAATGIRRDDPRLPDWQRDANTPEALRVFGRQC
jgi:hypothetical protein